MAGPIQYLPRTRPELRLLPAEQTGEHSIVRTDGKAVRMPNRFVALLLLCDGTRSARQVAELATVGGAPIPTELVVKLAEQMAAHGVVELLPRARAVATFGDPRQSCEACGASCEHHLIGPLSPERIAQIERDHGRLVATVPRLATQPALMPMPDGEGQALNVVDGRCVFLGEDRLCLLHRHFGPASKPLTCQTFPIASVETGAELRVGIQPSCYQWHRTFLVGAPVTASSLSEEDLGYRTPSASVALPPLGTPIAATPLEEEARLLRWLSAPDLTLAELLARLAGASPSTPPRSLVPAARAELLRRVLQRAGRRQLDAMDGHRTDTVHHGHTHALFAGLAQMATFDPDLTLPERHRAFVMSAIGQGVFIRETGRLPAPRLGALVLTLGAVVARQLAPPPSGADTIDDAFAWPMIAWNRRFVIGEAFLELFETPEDLGQLLTDWS